MKIALAILILLSLVIGLFGVSVYSMGWVDSFLLWSGCAVSCAAVIWAVTVIAERFV